MRIAEHRRASKRRASFGGPDRELMGDYDGLEASDDGLWNAQRRDRAALCSSMDSAMGHQFSGSGSSDSLQ